MTEEKGKAFVGGSFLYLDEAGGYEESNKDGREGQGPKVQKLIHDKSGIMQYQREMREKRA